MARLPASVVREILQSAQAADVISFAGGLPAEDQLPSLEHLRIPPSVSQYGLTEGEPALREAIAAHARSIGLSCTAQQVLVLSGSQQGIDLAGKLLIDDGTPVVTESPTYLAALQVFSLFGANVTSVKIHSGGVRADELADALKHSRARLAYLNPTFQNPTGYAYADEVRSDVAKVIDLSGCVLLEDDPYREISFRGPAPAPICARLGSASWIYQSTFSKTFVPGIRLGYLIASPDLHPHLVRLKQAADLHSNRLSQWIVASALATSDHAVRLCQLREGYRRKRDAFQLALEGRLGELASWERPEGGFFFWVRLRTPRDLMELLPRALASGVAFVPGSSCYPADATTECRMRLNYTHTSEEKMDEGLDRLAGLLR